MDKVNRKILHRVIVGQLMSWLDDDPWREGAVLKEWEADYIACLTIEQYLREGGPEPGDSVPDSAATPPQQSGLTSKSKTV